jgi:Na+/H+ antiporter NhaD/arsenite permease-like protein
LGANITFFGALAGLMWKKMLSDSNESVTQGQFFKAGILTMVPVILITAVSVGVVLVLS